MTKLKDRIRLGCGLLIILCLWAAPGIASADGAPPASTQIFDTITVDRDGCTLAIVGGNRIICQGGSATVRAELTCGPGYLQVAEPQWYLDGEPAGTGNEITVSPSPGTHNLLVTCLSCEDAITVDVVDCQNQPLLDAAFSDDATEGTDGIYMQPNIASVSQLNFSQLKFLMRPFSLAADSSVHVGSYQLTVSGDGVLQLFRTNGQQLTLPAVFQLSDLPAQLLANATGPGEARVRATYDTTGVGGNPSFDEVRVRVARSPGLAGQTDLVYPYFLFRDSFNDNSAVRTAIDPFVHSERMGLAYRVYVVAHKTPQGWAGDQTLVDVTGGYESAAVVAGSIQANVIGAWTSGLDGGNDVSKAYDVVYDFGLDGRLDPGDLIDGLSYDGVGCSVVRNLNLPGPYTALQATYSGGSWLGERTYYPQEVGSLGLLPLVVISHGNGHDYTWYDYLGNHLASHGYIVMSHQNNTGPGIETASTTTITNTDYFLSHLSTIAGGVLLGHVNDHNIVWVGHSRGGEGVVRAYDRVLEGAYVPTEFTASDIVLVSSIAPTVFLGATASDPHTVNYHMIAGGSDGDVSGAPDCPICQYCRLPDRALGTVMTTYVHGACHNDFNCCGFNDCVGPDRIGRAEAQVVAKSYYLALVEYYTKGNPAGREYMTRLYDDLHPSGIASNVVVASSYRELNTPANFVIDDFQTNPTTNLSSSGGAVTFDVSNIYEGNNDDNNTSFTWTTTDPMNGMTLNSGSGDFSKGTVFDYTLGDTKYAEWEVVPGQQDLRQMARVSFRACQGTRHPETVALNGPNNFSVTLRDNVGVSSTVRFGGWGNLSPLYQRTGSGTGAGWVNEMNTVQIDLSSFTTNGSGLDLGHVVAVRLDFGASNGSPRGRIGLDDIQFTKN